MSPHPISQLVLSLPSVSCSTIDRPRLLLALLPTSTPLFHTVSSLTSTPPAPSNCGGQLRSLCTPPPPNRAYSIPQTWLPKREFRIRAAVRSSDAPSDASLCSRVSLIHSSFFKPLLALPASRLPILRSCISDSPSPCCPALAPVRAISTVDCGASARLGPFSSRLTGFEQSASRCNALPLTSRCTSYALPCSGRYRTGVDRRARLRRAMDYPYNPNKIDRT